jgi:hypothetical protein
MTTPNPPTMTWVSPSSDTTPDFSVNLPSGSGAGLDAAVGDVLNIQYQTQGDDWSSPTTYLLRTLDGTDISTDIITVSSGTPISVGSYDFRARLERDIPIRRAFNMGY